MKKTGLTFLAICVLNICAFAHVVDYGNVIMHHWNIESNNSAIEGSFYMMRDGKVFIDKADNEIVSYPLNALSKEDQEYAMKRQECVKQINNRKVTPPISTSQPMLDVNFRLYLTASLSVIFLLLLLGLSKGIGQHFISKDKVRYAYPILTVGIIATLFGFNKAYRTTTTTNPAVIDSAFTPFKPNVITSWDTTYFYVQSHGIPTTHGMMVGISSNGWQQQVPIPQCYLLPTNAWSIPLKPTIATNHIPVDTIHFTRGAIAIAVNGVPIFNEHTNTGADALVAGQLDNYGGHCGRADDYHYHIAPLHLYGTTSANLPIAYAFDGFAVYGSHEPDGTSMAALDTNHGHFGVGGVYHYHGTTTYPYMIARFAGQVTEDGTHQLVPQAAASPVRGGQNPLPGALITSCQQVGTNGYRLIYTLSGVSDTVAYSWTPTGIYTFVFSSPGSAPRDSIYTGFIPCYVLPNIVNEITNLGNRLDIYPNPTNGIISIALNTPFMAGDVQSISVYNIMGQTVFHVFGYTQNIDTRKWPKGSYLVKIQLAGEQINRKLIVQ